MRALHYPTDYRNLFIRDFLLPAGNLRDIRPAAKRAHIFIVTKCKTDLSKEEKWYNCRAEPGSPPNRIFFRNRLWKALPFVYQRAGNPMPVVPRLTGYRYCKNHKFGRLFEKTGWPFWNAPLCWSPHFWFRRPGKYSQKIWSHPELKKLFLLRKKTL